MVKGKIITFNSTAKIYNVKTNKRRNSKSFTVEKKNVINKLKYGKKICCQGEDIISVKVK